MDTEFWNNFIKNVLEAWAIPELNRRQAAGKLPHDFRPYAVQIVIDPVNDTEVRFNEEVNAAVEMTEDGPPQSLGTHPVQDFSGVAPYIKTFSLPDDDHPNAGHITLIRNGTGWFASFDLRYNAQRVAEHVLAAQQFLASARHNLGVDLLRPFVADLFSAVELLSKSHLMLWPDEKFLKSKKHKLIISNFNREASLGNVPMESAALLNKLSRLRNSARYPVGPFSLDKSDAGAMLSQAEQLLDIVVSKIPARARRIISASSLADNSKPAGE